MSVAILYEPDGYRVDHAKPMGRHFAGLGFLSAYARHSRQTSFTGLVRRPELGRDFVETMRRLRPDVPARFIMTQRLWELKKPGCLYVPEPATPRQAWLRHLHGPRAWSLCGVNHTLSSARVMDTVTEWLTAPFQPWDAVVCTSQASRDVIRRLLDHQAAFLAERLGANRFTQPQLPVIPLGVDCAAQRIEPGDRERARSVLGIGGDDVVVLFLGRLSFHAKANPAPMYLALERIAARRRVVLVECGWVSNDSIAEAFADARAKLCPSVRSIMLDGRQPDARKRAWSSADIFCSLSDNIQETFGLTPIEAMAAGLPVVVTDWDGYKDTVRDGVDGFAIPTIAAPAGAGVELARDHALEIDSYDIYIAQASAATVVDVDATALALERLANSQELRTRLGANGAKRARELFDWRVVIEAYESLWEELAELRLSEGAAEPASRARTIWPARPDPFDLFGGFASAVLSPQDQVEKRPGVSEAEAVERLGLKLSVLSAMRDLTQTLVLYVYGAIGSSSATVETILAAMPRVRPHHAIRALLLLAKLGLVTIRRGEASAGQSSGPPQRP